MFFSRICGAHRYSIGMVMNCRIKLLRWLLLSLFMVAWLMNCIFLSREANHLRIIKRGVILWFLPSVSSWIEWACIMRKFMRLLLLLGSWLGSTSCCGNSCCLCSLNKCLLKNWAWTCIFYGFLLSRKRNKLTYEEISCMTFMKIISLI